MQKFSKDHEWINVDGDTGTVGISDYAQKQLGDVVYVSLIKNINEDVAPGDGVAEIESVKSVSEIYSPVDGTLIELNPIFEDESKSGIVNQDPYGEGWIYKIKVKDSSQIDSLMDENQYEEYINTL